MSDSAPTKVLVLGGLGFIGRRMVCFLLSLDRQVTVRVADKALPATAQLDDAAKQAFEDDRVKFIQANLTSEMGVNKAFKQEDGDAPFDIVINLAAETKFGLEQAVYDKGVRDLSLQCARAAASANVGRFIEMSTAQVYQPDSKASDESGKIKPWTNLARAKQEVETALASIDGLRYNILRPATVYGAGDKSGIFPRIICAAVYRNLGEKYRVLWSGDLKVNTVHVEDVCRATWHIATQQDTQGRTFNLADEGKTDQAAINKSLEEIFGIKTSFFGTLMSNMAKLDLAGAAETANDKHMEPWSEMCKAESILNTPLTPYIDKELLLNNHVSVDGSAITKATAFEYKHKKLTTDEMRSMITQYVEQKLFPAAAVPQ